MPNYKDASLFNPRPNDSNFDKVYLPGQPAPFSGIYKCVSCGFEAVSTRQNRLPPEASCAAHNTRTWPVGHAVVRWKLVAAAIHVKGNA